MQDGFDPYHRWLSIPPDQQPPDHYRLLGISQFESDPEVIALAADRQMSHVKTHATGKYVAASQTLLNELARAKVCLLDARTKSAYDAALGGPSEPALAPFSADGAAPVETPPIHAAERIGQPLSIDESVVTFVPEPAASRPTGSRFSKAPIGIGAAVGVFVLVVLGGGYLLRENDPAAPEADDGAAAPSASIAPKPGPPTAAPRSARATTSVARRVGPSKPPRLVQTFRRDDLKTVNGVEFSPDGSFLYATAWSIATHVVAAVNESTGKLTHVETIQDTARLNGATGLRLSPDGALAAACGFRSRTVLVYARDVRTGKLTYQDHKQSGVDGVEGLRFTTDAVFSHDGAFVYGVDDRSGLAIFRVAGTPHNPKLKFVASYDVPALAGMRNLACHRNGAHLLAACCRAHTLVVLTHDANTGNVTSHQILRNGEGGATGLGGATDAAFSPDGNFVYSVSGRFGGDNAVGVFEFDENQGRLKQIQMINQFDVACEDTHAPVAFQGGGEITVSPDGENVYAVATVSGVLAVFDRDPQTGQLKLTAMFGSPQSVGGAAGVTVSPDGRFLAVAAEHQSTISIFRRRD